MPLRFPRPVVPVIATGMAAVWVLAGSAPAFADQVRQQEWWLGNLNVSQAWQTSKGSGVTVAVLSDGIDGTQADLSGSVKVGPDYTNSGETATTYVGLAGTAIASLIAGHGHGGAKASGVIGVAPDSRILSVRVTLDHSDPALASTTIAAGLPGAIAAGIRYAVHHGAKVIDLPLDPGQAAATIGTTSTSTTPVDGVTPTPGTTPPPGSAAAGGSSAEKAAVAYALSKKVVLVAPAGDDGAGTDAANYPAAYPGVISVGAFDNKFVKASYSSHQPYVTVTAAGAGMEAATAGTSYATVSSTAAASAVVSGIAALIRSRYPSLSPTQVTRALTTSTVFRRAGGLKDGSGHGTVNAQRALAAAAAIAAPRDERAGAGASTLVKPTEPSVEAVTSNGLVPRILRAGIISAGVLILLLVLIAVYTAVGRRRERSRTAVTAEWARTTQSAYSPYGAGDADRMLEFFAAPAGDPSGASRQFTIRPPGSPAASGPGTAGSGVGAAGGGSAPGGPGAGDPGAAGTGAAGGGTAGRSVGAWVPLGPASRAQARQPRVSGAPPWEPAAEPDSELPWASVPGPAAATAGRRPAIASTTPAADSVWPSAPSTPATPPPTGRDWDDVAAGARGAGGTDLSSAASSSASPVAPPSAAVPSAGPVAPRTEGGRSPASADQPSPTARPARADRSAPGAAARAASSESAALAQPSPGAHSGSIWDAAGRPRSPSGSAWELADDEPQQRPASAPPPSASAPSAQAPAAYAEEHTFGPHAVDAQWQLPVRDATGWHSATEREPEPAVSDMHWLPAAPVTDVRADADAAPRWQPADSGEAAWLPADEDSRWQPAAGGSQPGQGGSAASWQPAAESSQSWQPAPESAQSWQRGVESGQSWQPASDDDRSWPSAVEDDRSWQPGGSAGTAWQPGGSADMGWQPGSAAGGHSPGRHDSGRQDEDPAPARWASDRHGDQAAADADELFAWRPAEQTETFPAISDD